MPATLTKALTSVALVGTLALAGCSAGTTASSSTSTTTTTSSSSAAATAVATASGTTVASVISYDTHYDADDLTWDASTEVTIDLSNPTATDGVTVENGVITITAAGNYRLAGTLADGQVVVAAGDEDVVRLILDNASITNSDGAAIDAENANETIIYTEADTTNTVTDGSTYAATGEEDPDAALYARTDLTLAGEGTLTVTGNYGDGIASGDGLTIAGGTIKVTAADDGIKGKDYVDILGGTIDVTATSDGIKATNDTDAERGWVRLLDGTVTISAGDDGFKSERELEIAGGTLTIEESVEAIEGQYLTISGGVTNATSSDDGINATIPSTTTTTTSGGFGGGMDQVVDAFISIIGGELTLNVEGDGIDSNGTAEISGGTVIVNGPSTGGNGATDAAGGLTITGGTLIQGDSGDMFEGMEGGYAQFSASVSSGDTVTVTNSSGEVVAEYTSTKTISQVVVAGSSVTEGETCTISVNGSEAGTATATSGAAAGGMGGFGGRP
ncbi:MAG TPA: carbohydrate-binding domain-containing protein [Candidatus Rothia avistercoris]|uniref:Carbohydrate-binding domain-containing protein n=1 Tax=Candidatus Rothia avistercoris TaxID=2840479 RepID=A0A9D2UEZ2_9MICC|nr:carbohydrate-binding domain-containing protein [Candidatus Rothia avistercoris]